tara:strand:- start:249 stop:572 length:324 start_codon:yes stop_codon:yes gene_type:complete
MAEVQVTGMNFHLILTPHEFVLVTKGLMGTIPEGPVERVSPDSPRANKENRGNRKVLINDKEDARDLGVRLMERRLRCAEAEVKKVNAHMNSAIEAMKELQSKEGGA